MAKKVLTLGPTDIGISLGTEPQAVLLVVDVPAKETHLPEGLTLAVHLSPAEAREAAHGLLRKAEEADQDSPLPHPGLA